MTWFVLYSDGNQDDGGVGYFRFDSQHEAIKFIEKRLANGNSGAGLECYTLLSGQTIELESYEQIIGVRPRS